MTAQKQIGIVMYGAGNIFSLCATLDRLQITYGMIYEASDFELYEKIIIPGVGHAGKAMEKLQNSRLVAALKNSNQWILGICVGMQLLTQHSEEGNAQLLNIFPILTKKFTANSSIKIPHMGWNKVQHQQEKIFKDIPQNAYFYFVHSFYIEYDEKYNLAKCEYGNPFSAAIQYKNYIGVQFHPEKSGQTGEKLLLNFTHLK